MLGCIIAIVFLASLCLGGIIWFIYTSHKYCGFYSKQIFEFQREIGEREETLNSLRKDCEKLKNEIVEKQKDILNYSSKIETLKSTFCAVEQQVTEKPTETAEKGIIKLTNYEKEDIEKLNYLKLTFHQPRVISKLIWETYYQKQFSSLCAEVLGTKPVTGIYRIVNMKNNKCYIGQCGDMKGIAERWKKHAKCGCGIDTPATSKLYKAMLEDGLFNFKFQLVEECPKDELDVKEKFYIDLYKSKDYGYNSTIGNGKENLI